MKRAHIIIKGRVQGVCFRMETQNEAIRVNANGWVRNLRNGNVEAVFEGEDDMVNEMIQWCKHGPPGAKVKDISVDWEDYKGEFHGFSITY